MGIYWHTCTRVIIIIVILDVIQCEDKIKPRNEVQHYEYGKRVKGDQISFKYMGLIPAFQPFYNMTIEPKEGFEEQFSYLIAECINPISKVTFEFNNTDFVLSCHIKFPLIDTPLGILGYSKPKPQKKVYTSMLRLFQDIFGAIHH